MKAEIEIKNKINEEKSIKVAAFHKHVRRTTPHKHNSYFEIVYLSKGSGYHYVDDVRFNIEPPMIFFVRKEQVHHWELDSEPDGFVLIIKNNFIRSSLDKEIDALISQLSSQLALKVKNRASIDALFDLLCKETRIDFQKNSRVVVGLLKALLAKILIVTQPHARQQGGISPTYNSFHELLSREKNLINRVEHYAEALNISPQNLNTICRKASGPSASEIIADCMVSEAKRLLTYTDKTISEVAFELNFKDPSHFVKYFKRHTSQTPKSYRESVRLVP